MSKDHSEQDTRLTPSKLSLDQRSSILDETRRALEHYSQARKEYLKEVKKEYLKQIEEKKVARKDRSTDRFDEKRRRKKKREKTREMPTRINRRLGGRTKQISGVNYRQSPEISQQEESEERRSRQRQLNQVSRRLLSVQRSNNQDEGLEQGKFQLKPVHEGLLQLQRTIDNYLDYQFCHRRKRSILLQDLFGFLKTTKFALNGFRYFQYLRRYNANLYELRDERIDCFSLQGQVGEQRLATTRRGMSRVQIKELLI